MKIKYNLEDLSMLVKGELFFMILSSRISDKLLEKYSDLYKDAYLHLMYIKNIEGISQIELAKLSLNNKSTIHRNVNQLIKNGYVKKQISKRANENEVYLTKKGEQAVKDINVWVSEYEQNLKLDKEKFEWIDNLFLEMIIKNKKY